jgi:hypothetical protein
MLTMMRFRNKFGMTVKMQSHAEFISASLRKEA